jgi:hypothetical protein
MEATEKNVAIKKKNIKHGMAWHGMASVYFDHKEQLSG